MTARSIRRLVAGFAVGILAGWVGGLLRTPQSAPAGSSAADAATLPQERFGQPAGESGPDARAQDGGTVDVSDVATYDATQPPEPAMSVAPTAGVAEAPAPAAPPAARPKPAKKVAASKPAKPTKPAGSSQSTRRATKPVKGTTTATPAPAGEPTTGDQRDSRRGE
jgi:hypothetical protein